VKTNLFDLKDRRILVTGSNGGIGYTIAQGLAQHGANIILNGRDQLKLERAAESLQAQGFQVETSRFDVTIESEIEQAILELETRGSLDVLINNAGIQRRVSLENLSLETWNQVLTTNLTSAMLVSRTVARGMIAQKSGKIINICSLMSDVARTTTGAYTAAKGGLKMLTKAMCADWAQHNLQINAIGPGYFATEMTKPLVENQEFNAWVVGRTPAKRWGQPEELIGAAVFLSSQASNFVNGQILYVDGGMISVL
jgi:gluconate 5-dehydrogenase